MAAPVYTTSDPDNPGKLSNGIEVATELGTPLHTKNTENMGELSDGIQVYTKAVVGPSLSYTYAQGEVADGIAAYFKDAVSTDVSYTYAQGEVADGLAVYTEGESPSVGVPYTTLPATPGDEGNPSVPEQPTTPSQPEESQVITTGVDEDQTPADPQPDQQIQPIIPDQPESNQTITTGVDEGQTPEIVKAHQQPKLTYLTSETASAESQTNEKKGSATSAKVNQIRAISLKGSIKAQPQVPESKAATLPQSSDEPGTPISVLGYFMLAVESLIGWIGFSRRR